MTVYYKAKGQPVEWYSTKYDGCKLVHTGKPYRFQKGSGRAEMLNTFGENGKTLGEITQAAAQAGFDPNFVIGSILKHIEGKDAAFALEAPEGNSLSDIKATRQARRMSPEQQERAEAAKAEREAAKAKKAEERAAKKAEHEAAAKAKKAERDAAAEKAKAEKAEAEKAKAATSEAPATGGKGKKGKNGTVAASDSAEAKAEDAAAAV